ncbi:unknown [Prevotella sp. CAG:1320]|nr:unknown [Prevotella sp. CAG:1320]
MKIFLRPFLDYIFYSRFILFLIFTFNNKFRPFFQCFFCKLCLNVI